MYPQKPGGMPPRGMPPQGPGGPQGGAGRMNPQMLALMKQKLAQRKQMGGQPPQGGQMGGMGRPPMGGMPQPQGQPPMGPGMPGAMPPQGGMPGMPMQGMTNPEDEKLQRLLEILKMI